MIQDKSDQMNDIIFKDIPTTCSSGESFGYAYYGLFRVIMMKSNGYINVTKLCNDGGKKFFHWKENATSKELLNKMSSLGMSRDDLLVIISGGQQEEIRGTYAHPDLIPHIACWISADFAIMVSKIVNAHIHDKYAILLKEKDTKIDELMREIKQSMSDLSDDVQDANDKLDVMSVHLNISKEQRVVPSVRPDVMEVYKLFHIDGHNYTSIRVQERGLKQAVKRVLTKNPNARDILTLKHQPSAININHRLKDKFKDFITISGTNITLTQPEQFSESKLLDILFVLNEDRYSDPKIEEAREQLSLEQLEKLTMIKLRDLCRANSIKGYSKFNKRDLITFLMDEGAYNI
jgi:hypothetical protein